MGSLPGLAVQVASVDRCQTVNGAQLPSRVQRMEELRRYVQEVVC